MFSRIAVCIALVGCATTETETNSTEQDITKCSPDFCGGNSPTISHYGFYNFNLDGQPNNAGFVLMGMSQGNYFYDLIVQGSRIYGVGPWGTLSGGKLIGATIWIQNINTKYQYGIRIDDVGLAQEVVDPYSPIETYLLNYGPVVGRPLPRFIPGGNVFEAPVLSSKITAVCPYPPDPYGPGSPIEWDESQSQQAHMSPFQTLVYEGDVIHEDTRTIEQKPDDRWFNIGCAAHTLTKLRLTRNTVKLTPWYNAQTALKALSGDYCGDGHPFTVSGQPIVWREGAVKMSFWQTPEPSSTSPFGLEARWNEYGALCLEEPRLQNSSFAPNPNVFNDIEYDCKVAGHYLLPCSYYDEDPNVNVFRGERLTTGLRF